MLKYLLALIIVFTFAFLKIGKPKFSRGILFTLKTILIVLFLEVTVFNINSYRTDFGKTKIISYYGEDLENRISKTNDNTLYINLNNLNTKIKSIYVELSDLKEKQVVDYDIFYSDESTSTRFLATKNYCDDVEKTKYSVISLSRGL